MKEENAIIISELSKRYALNARGEGTLTGSFQKMFQSRKKKYFFALKDFNLNIKKGETVGIIGHNGAGKSTLLKILSRITPPTSGRIEINGRISSLLEVGTGFHPELSGRENIYLNGSILGMRRKEIKLKFDEIVEFSGLEKFIDTPVKRYSSGMYVRLAFAIAAHLDPDILLLDEVFAVGDYEFQKKCLGKIEDVVTEGRTIIFVSHQLDFLKAMVNKGVVIDHGELKFEGPIDEAIHFYTKEDFRKGIIIKGGEEISLIRGLEKPLKFIQHLHMNISLIFNADKNFENMDVDFAFCNDKEIKVLHFRSQYLRKKFYFKKGENEVLLTVQNQDLIPGRYYIIIYITNSAGQVFLWIEKAGDIIIQPKQNYWAGFIQNNFAHSIPEFNIEVE